MGSTGSPSKGVSLLPMMNSEEAFGDLKDFIVPAGISRNVKSPSDSTWI
jgi:hypothetical protein